MARIIYVVKLLIIVTIMISCSKEEIILRVDPVTPTPRTPSPFSGQEFLFDSLTWRNDDPNFWDEIYVGTPSRPDLFSVDPALDNTYLDKEVFLKVDTAANWINVKSGWSTRWQIFGQYYYTIIPTKLIVYVNPLNYEMLGRKAAIKVRFL